MINSTTAEEKKPSYQENLDKNAGAFKWLILIISALFMMGGSIYACHPLPPATQIDSDWIEEHSQPDPTIPIQITTATEVYEKPSPEGWNGWTRWTRVDSGKREEGGFHWTFGNVDSFYREKGLLPVKGKRKLYFVDGWGENDAYEGTSVLCGETGGTVSVMGVARRRNDQ